MAFHDIVFPLSVDRCLSTHEWLTEVLELGNGEEQRIPQWEDGRRKFDASLGVRSLKDLQDLLKFHALRRGRAFGFKVRDLVDYEVKSGEGVIGAYVAGQNTLQLAKNYTDAANSWTREIRKPEQGTVKVFYGAAQKTEGVDYSINYSTGALTILIAPAVGIIISATLRFYVPVRFVEDSIPAAEMVAAMKYDGTAAQDFVVSGSVDLPEVPMIEIKDYV